MKNYRQEIFTKVYRHLMKQKKKSTRVENSFAYTCAYRGDNGAMCAVGCLISDEKYTPSLEGRSVRNTAVQCAIPKRYAPHIDLLFGLQKIHDLECVADWEVKLQALATRNNLKIPKLVK